MTAGALGLNGLAEALTNDLESPDHRRLRAVVGAMPFPVVTRHCGAPNRPAATSVAIRSAGNASSTT